MPKLGFEYLFCKTESPILKQLTLLIAFLFLSGSAICQKNPYLKLAFNPTVSWLSTTHPQAIATNSFGVSFGMHCDKKLSVEIGLSTSKTGGKFERVFDTIAIPHGFTYQLVIGKIPVKERSAVKFIGVPIRIGYSLPVYNNLKFTVFYALAANLYLKTNEKTWYYYQTADEFFDESDHTYVGQRELTLSYQLGVEVEKKLLPRLSVTGGINYMNLFHEIKFPQLPAIRNYHNLGLVVGLKYNLKREQEVSAEPAQ